MSRNSIVHCMTRSRVFLSGFLTVAMTGFVSAATGAALTEVWSRRVSNLLHSTDWAVKVVSDSAGDVIVTGSTEDNTNPVEMLTMKYSGRDGSLIWQNRQRGDPESGWNSFVTSLAVDTQGNVIVGGSSGGDYYVAKYQAASGALLWEKRYNGPGTFESDDFVRAIAVDSDGNVVVSGDSRSAGPYNVSDYYTAKYAAGDGALLWERRYDGPANRSDFVTSMAVDSSGNVVVTGSSQGGLATGDESAEDFYTAKYAAADGALLWQRRFNGPADRVDIPNAVTVDGSGNVLVTGTSQNGPPLYNSGFYTAKYAASDGALLWERRYSGPAKVDDAGTAIAVDGSGNVLVTGTSADRRGYSAYYTAKYAALNGELLWEKRYDGPVIGNDSPTAVLLDNNGNVIVTGSSAVAGSESSGFTYSSYTVKYAAADGQLLWERYGASGPVAAAVDSEGNVLVTGSSSNNGLPGTGSNSDYYTAKYAASTGNLLWEKTYDALTKYDAGGEAVALDSKGNILVTGGTEGIGGVHGSYTAKYAAVDGALLWEKRGAGRGVQVLVDGGDNVVTTGYSWGSNGPDYYTAKYTPAGALLWAKSYTSGLSDSDDRATAVALDSRGNVVVTGISARHNFNSDYYTAKYASADGALLWQRRYNGPANQSDQANAVAVDADDNVVVTGSSDNAQGHADYYTVKYAAADGAPLWEKRYSGPPESHDVANALALDGSGNVVVTGGSAIGGSATNGFSSYGYYTAKYASADGALLWEKRYAGLENRFEQATAVVVDNSGNVFVTGSLATLKYAAADGALLWENRYSEGSGGVIALDENGNAVVDGARGVVGPFTAKYASTDGSLIWEKIYAGLGSFWHNGPGAHLALGPNGIVALTGRSNLNSPRASDILTVVYREGLSAVSLELVGIGVRLNFTGTAGQSYTLQRAATLAGPWKTINTKTAPTSGLIEFQEQIQPPETAFYRMRQP